MIPAKPISWQDPRNKIWGFHVHQELALENFAESLVVQSQCAAFLQKNGIVINADDVMKPGYGPHLNYMWELRVERSAQPLEHMGLAISYMAVNRFGLSAYIHPVMHDESLPIEAALAAEGRYNQANALWFSQRVRQNQDFFFNPPKDKHNQLIDTRSPRICSRQERKHLYDAGKAKFQYIDFFDPYQAIINGFHIHMDFSRREEETALLVFDNFLRFLLEIGLRPSSTRLYGPGENGPHIQQGWEVKFETQDKRILQKIGIAIGWLMCNRQHLSVFIHPVTWEEGDHPTEFKAHAEYSMFIGDLPPLDLNFFKKKFEE